MQQKELGFDKENIVVLPLVGAEVQLKYQTLKTELSKRPDVLAVTASSDVPYSGFTSNGYFPEGYKTPVMIHVVDVDSDFLQAFNLELVKGRNFSPEFATDKTAYLINETLAQTLGWDDPMGTTIVRDGKHQIIGVVEDFDFATLHDRIAPSIITPQPWLDRFENLSDVNQDGKIGIGYLVNGKIVPLMVADAEWVLRPQSATETPEAREKSGGIMGPNCLTCH